MNFLAHFCLSDNDESLIIGNFLGDFVKGKQYQEYPQTIAQGILLHRAIDSFTDQHLILQAGKDRLRPKFGRYAPILLDILLDYLLASFWKRFYTVPLPDFSANIYAVLSKNKVILPQNAQIAAYYMEKENWLMRYESIAGTKKSLQGMAHRLGVDLPFEDSIDILLVQQDEFLQEFLIFWKEINEFVVHFHKDC